MLKYFIIAIIILWIMDLISEIRKRFYNKKLMIAKGLLKFNSELLLGIFCTLVFVMFCTDLYNRPPEWFVFNAIIQGMIGSSKLLKGTTNEIREDGIYTNKGIYIWDQITRYEWMKTKKRKRLLKGSTEYVSLRFYMEDNYPDKITMNIATKDIKKIEVFFEELGLKEEKIDLK